MSEAPITPAEPRRRGRPRTPGLEERRRAGLLAAAEGVFARHGFAAADVQEVADRAGVGKGTLYRYFPTKDALFLATVQAGVDDLTVVMDRIFDEPGPDPLGLMVDAVRAYFAFFAARPALAELFVQERASFPSHHRPLYFAADAECEAKHAAVFARLVESGAIRSVPPERFFTVLGDLMYGTILTNLLTGRPADPARQADDVLDVVLYGLVPRPDAKGTP